MATQRRHRKAKLSTAADIHDMHPKTLARWVREGKITGYKAGRLIYVDLDELDALFTPIPSALTSGGGSGAA